MRENMAYQALYRKWRPLEFEDVKGQEHIVTTLKIRYGQTESGMRTFSAERAEPVRQPWQRFLQRRSTASIRWTAVRAGNVQPVRRLPKGVP